MLQAEKKIEGICEAVIAEVDVFNWLKLILGFNANRAAAAVVFVIPFACLFFWILTRRDRLIRFFTNKGIDKKSGKRISRIQRNR